MVPIERAYFLAGLTPREVNRVAAFARQVTFPGGTSIVKVGAKVEALFVVASGSVRVVVPVDRGGDPVDAFGEMGAGECFGELSFADRAPASASVIALGETVVHELPYADLDSLLESDPALALKLTRSILHTVVGRLRSTDADLAMAYYVLRFV